MIIKALKMEDEGFLKSNVHNADINIIKNIINDFEVTEYPSRENCNYQNSYNNLKNSNKRITRNNKKCKVCYYNYHTVSNSEPVINRAKKIEMSPRTKNRLNRSLDNYTRNKNINATGSLQNFNKSEDNFYLNFAENTNGSENQNAISVCDLEQSKEEHEKLNNNNLRFESITNITKRKLYSETKRRQTFVAENVKKVSSTIFYRNALFTQISLIKHLFINSLHEY